jgi:hypothetical protein
MRGYILSSSIFTGLVVGAASVFVAALLLDAEWARALGDRFERGVRHWWQTEDSQTAVEADAPEPVPEITLWDLPPGVESTPLEARIKKKHGTLEPRTECESVRALLCELVNERFGADDPSWRPLSSDEGGELESRLAAVRERLDALRAREAQGGVAREALRQLRPHTLARMLRYYPDEKAFEVLEALGPVLAADVLERLAPMDPRRAAQLTQSHAFQHRNRSWR